MKMDLAKWATEHKIPDAVAMVARVDEEFFRGTHGDAEVDTIFAIASMTKAITTTAAMQLVASRLQSRNCGAPNFRIVEAKAVEAV